MEQQGELRRPETKGCGGSQRLLPSLPAGERYYHIYTEGRKYRKAG